MNVIVELKQFSFFLYFTHLPTLKALGGGCAKNWWLISGIITYVSTYTKLYQYSLFEAYCYWLM